MNGNKIQVENFMDFNSDAIISIGTRISLDHPKVKAYIDTMVSNNETEFIYMHPIDDVPLQDKYTQYIKYEAGSEEGVLALLAAFIVKKTPAKYQDYIEDLDVGNLSGESSVGEEEFELLVEKLENKKEVLLLVGDDIYEHSQFENIVNLIRFIDMYSSINVVLLGKEKTVNLDKEIRLEEVSNIHTYNGSVVYITNSTDNILRGSNSFAMAAKIKDADTVNITYDNTTVQKRFEIDSNIRGTIALLPLGNISQEHKKFEGYRFKQVKINKVNGK